MKTKFYNFIAKVTAVATIMSTLTVMVPARAANLTSASDTLTRLQQSVTADHVISFTSAAGYDFDIDATNTDVLIYNFSTNFAQGGTWQTADFAFNDGTARTINAVAAGTTFSASCADGADNVGVYIDTDDLDFYVYPCGASFTDTATNARAFTFTIYGTTTTGTGTLTNPTAATEELAVRWTDEGVAGAHLTDIQIPIVDSDQVTVTANVDPSMTFDIDTGVATSANTTPTYTVDFGVVGTGDVEVSGSTDAVNHIGLDLSANATGGAVITIQNANGSQGMVSTSGSPDNIANAAGTMAAGTENYGFCVVYATAGTGTLQINSSSNYNGLTCASDSNTNQVAALTTTPHTFLDSAGAALDAGRAVLVGNAAISSTTDAHDDYTDTLTFIATGTF